SEGALPPGVVPARLAVSLIPRLREQGQPGAKRGVAPASPDRPQCACVRALARGFPSLFPPSLPPAGRPAGRRRRRRSPSDPPRRRRRRRERGEPFL
ncbi:hypothetical protein E2320_006751, partial [Naja naja]